MDNKLTHITDLKKKALPRNWVCWRSIFLIKNAALDHGNDKVRRDVFTKQLDFNVTSIQNQRKNVADFKFY